MSEPTTSQKPPTTHHLPKPKVEPESHLSPTGATKVESSNLVQDELLDVAPSSVLRPAGSTILHPPGSGVLSSAPSTLLQHSSGVSTSNARPLAANGFAGRNFAGLPTRGTVQTKLTVGAAHDPYEEEADQVADQVMRMPASTFAAPAGIGAPDDGTPSLQRAFEEEEEVQAKPLASTIRPVVQRASATIDEDVVKQVVAEDAAQSDSVVQRAAEEEDELQAKRISAADSFETDDGFEGRVAATRGNGRPLPDTVRTFMEPRFGADFSGVRVHADGEAANLNRQVSAQAFTLGQDIYLGEGKTDVTSESGKRLLAHELTHVVQQGGAVARKTLVQRATDPETETEAPPLSLDAALAEAQTEVTEADVAQEDVVLEAEPVELPADNKVAGVDAQAAVGGEAAPAATTEAAAAPAEVTAAIGAQNTSTTKVTGALEETATQLPAVNALAASISTSAIEPEPVTLSGASADSNATSPETPVAPAATTVSLPAPITSEKVATQAPAPSASAATTNVPANELAQATTRDASSAATKTAADKRSQTAATDDVTTARPAAGAAASAQPAITDDSVTAASTRKVELAPSGNVPATTANVPANEAAQPTTPGAVPAKATAPIRSTTAPTAADVAPDKQPQTAAPAVNPVAKAASAPAPSATPATTPAAFTGSIEKTAPTTGPAPVKPDAAVKPGAGTAASVHSGVNPTEATVSTQPAAASTVPATVRPEDEEKKPVRRTLLRRMIQRALAVAPRSAEEDPAFQQVVAKSKAAAQQEKAHKPAQSAAAESQAAADPKGKDVEMEAQKRQVADMRAQPTGAFNAEAFKQKLFEKIKETAPQNLKEADEFKKNNKVGAIKNSIVGEVKEQKQQAEGPLEKETEQAPDKGGIPGKAVKGLEKTDAGPHSPDIGAKDAAPKPKTEAEVSVPLQEQSKSLDQQMVQGGVTEEQLANSNEPAFQQALKEKKDAQQNAQDAPAAYRKDEQALLGQAQGDAQATADAKSKETRSEKEQLLAQVFGLQGQTKGVDESKRQEVSAHVADIYLKTKQEVEQILNGMDGKVNELFEKGATAAKQAFEDHVDQRMSKYKWDRYLSRLDGPLLWVKDQFAGLPEEVNAFYAEGRNLYLAKMDACLTGVANYVAAELTRAKQRIADGQQTLGKYVAGLSPELQQVGRDATQKMQGKFDELVGSVDSKQEELVDSLAQSYHEKLQEVDTRIDEMKQANSGLINKATQAIGGVIKTIRELGQLLLNTLQRAAGAVSLILKDPIKFLGNLITGVAQGLQRFGSNILQHLQTGLLGWLTGALGGVITVFPKSFTDLRGILSMVLEILGLTYAQIRGKVVKAIGQKGDQVVGALEKAWEIFQIIRTQGLGGLWEFIKDMVGDLKAMVIDQIQSIIANEVIQAGIQWIVSLLGGPAGAFVKAVQAIIKIVTWFVNNASRLLAFVNSVLDSIVSIASGNVSAAAQYIENTLAKALPLVIGFLADLLGLGGIAKKVQKVIDKIRAPIDKAIAWIVKKAVALAKKILAKLRGVGKKDKDQEADKDYGKIKQALSGAVKDADLTPVSQVPPQVQRTSITIGSGKSKTKYELETIEDLFKQVMQEMGFSRGSQRWKDAKTIVHAFYSDGRHFSSIDAMKAALEKELEIKLGVKKVDWEGDPEDDHPEKAKFFELLDSVISDAGADQAWNSTIAGIKKQLELNLAGKKHNPNPDYEALSRQLANQLKGLEPFALWSGGIETSLYARKRGYTTLEATAAGKVYDRLKLFKNFTTLGPMWNHLSTQFVSSMSGEVHVFMRVYSRTSVLFRQEIPGVQKIRSVVSAIKWHVLRGRNLASLAEINDKGDRVDSYTFDSYEEAVQVMTKAQMRDDEKGKKVDEATAEAMKEDLRTQVTLKQELQALSVPGLNLHMIDEVAHKFLTLTNLKRASKHDLETVKGMDAVSAASLYYALH